MSTLTSHLSFTCQNFPGSPSAISAGSKVNAHTQRGESLGTRLHTASIPCFLPPASSIVDLWPLHRTSVVLLLLLATNIWNPRNVSVIHKQNIIMQSWPNRTMYIYDTSPTCMPDPGIALPSFLPFLCRVKGQHVFSTPSSIHHTRQLDILN